MVPGVGDGDLERVDTGLDRAGRHQDLGQTVQFGADRPAAVAEIVVAVTVAVGAGSNVRVPTVDAVDRHRAARVTATVRYGRDVDPVQEQSERIAILAVRPLVVLLGAEHVLERDFRGGLATELERENRRVIRGGSRNQSVEVRVARSMVVCGSVVAGIGSDEGADVAGTQDDSLVEADDRQGAGKGPGGLRGGVQAAADDVDVRPEKVLHEIRNIGTARQADRPLRAGRRVVGAVGASVRSQHDRDDSDHQQESQGGPQHSPFREVRNTHRVLLSHHRLFKPLAETLPRHRTPSSHFEHPR